MKRFPKTLYVTREIDGDTDWLSTNEEVPDVNENTPLAIYQLVEVNEIIVTREVKKQEIKRAR